jgi:formylmethanofuran dehydrogenase subunit D
MYNMTELIEVQEDDDGNQFIQFSPAMLEKLGWKEGDTVEWTDNGNGSWTLTKKE